MAVRDGERHLRESVESILGQTYRDLELLVVDDASTDASRAIVRSYGDPRVRVLVNEHNLGLTASLNRGLAVARGRYIARQDADDVSDRSRLERQVELLQRRPAITLVASHHRRIDDEGRHGGDRIVPTEPLDIRWRLLFLNAFTHSSVVFRRDVVRALGGYDDRFRYAQDYELWSRLARGHALAAVPEVLVAYRRSSGSMTATFDRAGGEILEIVAENLRAIGVDPARVDRDAARQLLFGDPRRIPTPRAVAASGAIMEVQAAFARGWALDEGVARRHRTTVARRVGSCLVRVGLERRHFSAALRGARLLAASRLRR